MSTVSDDFTIDLRRLRVLSELEARGTIAATARALHLTPSAVSQQIAGLSRDLGVPLLERHGRGVLLTGQARVMLKHAFALRQQLELARADLDGWRDGAIGEVRVASLSTGIARVVAPAMKALAKRRPGLSLWVVEDEPGPAVAALDAGDIDVAVVAEVSGAPGANDARYHRVDLFTDVMDVVMPKTHPLANPDGVALAELADETWVGARPTDTCALICFAVCSAAGFAPQVRHFGRDWDAVAALVAAGAGVALVPRSAFPLRQRGVIARPIVGSPSSREMYALTRAGNEAHPDVAAVLEEFRQVAATLG